jgi:reversibly glycosylated polypeptide/UDP-arabinopyranose mutase
MKPLNTPLSALRPSAASIGVCVPTIRRESLEAYLAAWKPVWNALDPRPDLKLFVHEDRPERSQTLATAQLGFEVVHTCHADLTERLNSSDWIVPRGSGACRSFPMYLAWQAGCEYVITMDDDCLPPEDAHGAGERFLAGHLEAFELDSWFRTLDGDDPRGIPYGSRGRLPVLLNHGLWTGVPDLDGPTSLVRARQPQETSLRARHEIVPPGVWFPLCGMNVCYHRSAIPAAYNLLMGVKDVGFDRFDDIWSGLFLKRIADHLGLYCTTGLPFVHHSKASNYFVNLRKEALGIHLNEFVWRHVSRAPLFARSVRGAFAELGRWMRELPHAYPEAPDAGDYFERLGDAMQAWTELCEGPDELPPHADAFAA